MRAALVDVSRWQEECEPAELKAAGFVGVIARCTMGMIAIDEQYLRTQQKTLDEGMIFMAYHLLWPENQEPELEAEWFDENAGEIHGAVLDTELTHGLPKENVLDQSYRWFKQMEINNPVLRKTQYTGSWWWDIAHGQLEQEYDLHEAEYTAMLPRGGVDKTRAPIGNPDSLSLGWDDWAFWQWTSAGKPIGVQSNELDYNVFNGTVEELEQYLGLAEPPPPPPSDLEERVEEVELQVGNIKKWGEKFPV